MISTQSKVKVRYKRGTAYLRLQGSDLIAQGHKDNDCLVEDLVLCPHQVERVGLFVRGQLCTDGCVCVCVCVCVCACV